MVDGILDIIEKYNIVVSRLINKFFKDYDKEEC